jgi:hypothetical protein
MRILRLGGAGGVFAALFNMFVIGYKSASTLRLNALSVNEANRVNHILGMKRFTDVDMVIYTSV